MGKIIIAGIGPGSAADVTPAVLEAVREADAIVGYKYYFQFIEAYVKEGCDCIDTGMKKERERAEQAFLLAEQGKTVVVISSGDAGIYGMAPLIYEMQRERSCATVSPSQGRYWQLYRLQELFLQERAADTPVGYVRQAGREEQEVKITTLGAFDPEEVDMFTVILIGNSQSYVYEGKMITPRGYYRNKEQEGEKPGQTIMMQSFSTILSEMQHPDVPTWRLWPLLHAIHTTVDFSMEQCLWMDECATEILYNKVVDGSLKHIVTDVTMAASGIRKGALERLGIQVHCYINDPRTKQIADEKGITRSQACMQQAAEEYPEALYVVGRRAQGRQ